MKIHEKTFLCPCCNVLHKVDQDDVFMFETNGVVCGGTLDEGTESIYFSSVCSHIGAGEHYSLPELPGVIA